MIAPCVLSLLKGTLWNRSRRRRFVRLVAISCRRNLLKIGGFAGLGLLASATGNGLAQTPPVIAGDRRRVLRVAHITDVHVQKERGGHEGLVACLRHIQSQPKKVDLILNTGDSIFDSTNQQAARTDKLWTLWNDTLAAHNKHRIECAIGNHDVWGWNKTKSKTTGSEARWGKDRALDGLGIEARYRSFDHGGWHFVVLDSIAPGNDSIQAKVYQARLDDEQFAWLEKDLAGVDASTPVLVMSHIPIFSITPLVAPDVDKTGDFAFSAGAIHIDGKRIKKLFEKYPNVKVAISGHQHLVDRVDYNGVSYLCNGAVSGGWWKGKNLDECDAGYALLNLYSDGTFDRDYVPYGWAYREA